jgi:hypothetical protein
MRRRSLRLAGAASAVAVLLTMGTAAPALATTGAASARADYAAPQSTSAPATSPHVWGYYLTYDSCDFTGFDNWVAHGWLWACTPFYQGRAKFWTLWEIF